MGYIELPLLSLSVAYLGIENSRNETHQSGLALSDLFRSARIEFVALALVLALPGGPLSGCGRSDGKISLSFGSVPFWNFSQNFYIEYWMLDIGE